MITEYRCYIVTCNECGDSLDTDNFGMATHYNSVEQANKYAKDHGWKSENDLHLCEYCSHHPRDEGNP